MVHVYGRRYNPFGPQIIPTKLKTREYTEIRDRAIWAALQGKLSTPDQMQKLLNSGSRIIYHLRRTVRMGM